VLIVYVALTVAVIVTPSPVLDLDSWFVGLHLWSSHPQYWTFIHTYVMLGQRGPATLAFLPVFIWVSVRRRSIEPLVMLGTALIALNLSVGVVKYAIGRIGPRHSNDVHQLFVEGGTIYPSGHVANAVVLYGLLAWIAPKFRRTLIGVAVFICASVGMGTIYLRTHWFSDVVAGWAAGGLVLLVLPSMVPAAQRRTELVIDAVRARRQRRRAHSTGPTEQPEPAGQEQREPVGAAPAARHRKATSSVG
jgi:membrane-associated phospholipid phosphatase